MFDNWQEADDAFHKIMDGLKIKIEDRSNYVRQFIDENEVNPVFGVSILVKMAKKKRDDFLRGLD
jgi:hypothetical protein